MFDLRPTKRALLLLLLAMGTLLVSVQGFRLLLLPAIESVFHPGENVTSGVRRGGILLFAVLGYWVYARFVEKRKVTELKPKATGVLLGGLSGALPILLVMSMLFAIGAYELTAYRGLDAGLWGVACVILIAAMLEEIVFRGILFRLLEGAWGTLPALWLQSLIFALLHIANVEDWTSTPALIITIVSGTFIGALWTMVFVHTRNLWTVGIHHAAWNFTIILAGLPLSGLEHWRGQAPLLSQYHGSVWLTGGVVGPEDSLVTILLVATALAWLLLWARVRKRLVQAGDSRVEQVPSTLGQAHPEA